MGRENDPIVRAFVQAVQRSISPSRIVLFGSRARKTARSTSDYDFLVISPCFRKWEWEERSARVYHLKRNIPAPMDIICLTPEEFKRKKKSLGVIREVVKEGIAVG